MAESSVVDFHNYGLNVKDIKEIKDDTLKELGNRMVEAFRTFGFCYLQNHGADEKIINDYMAVSRVFFEQPKDVKEKLPLNFDCEFGWLNFEGEILNPDRKTGDFKETFNYTPMSGKEIWPPTANFEALTKKFFEVGSALSMRILDVVSLGLDLPVDLMRGNHRLVGKKGNGSQIRTLYYPAIPKDHQINPDQARLSEHIDYGTFSCNFQDSVGGLQVRNPEGEFVPVTPIPGTVVVAVGALLQRWTSDYLQGTMHRILMPVDEQRENLVRQALVFFLEPDDACVVTCLDGSNKYEPTSARRYAYDKHVNQYV